MSQEESFAEKKEDLASIDKILEEQFGKDRLPKDLVLEMVNIRKEIRNEIENENFLAGLDETLDSRIRLLVAKIYNPSFKDEEIEKVDEGKEGQIFITLTNGELVMLGMDEQDLLFSMRAYFDSYRLAHNAGKFRGNVEEIKDGIIKDNQNRKINFYEDSEKQEELLSELKEKYVEAGFSEEELRELIKTCDINDLNNLSIHEIKIMNKVQDIFSRFMGGDKTKYVTLSAALMIPAFIQGYAPSLLADAFKENNIDIQQVFYFVCASSGGVGLSALIQKHYKDFINENFQKEGGVSEFTSRSLAEMPPDEIKKFGLDTVKHRSNEGRNSYEDVLRSFSFDILPAVTTLLTSVVMLYQKSPILAGGTVVASGITIALDRYIEKAGKVLGKERDSERTSEKMAKKLNEQLSAHMEVILAGEKEKFFNDVKEFIEKDKIAQSNKDFSRVLQRTYFRLNGALNLAMSAVASYLAGGTTDKFLSALMYSGNFIEGIHDLLSSKRRLLQSLRKIMQMEDMFNGYAAEEEEKEKDRVSVEEIKGSEINLKGINVEMEGKKILDNISLNIPSGSMVYLEGASGAGKTTLMKIISGYYHPNSGEVNFGGVKVENIKKSGEGRIYQKIACLSQFPYLFEDTLENNLNFGLSKKVAKDAMKEVLKDVGLDGRFKDLKEKLFSGSGDFGKTSGGETSRLGLARVLLKIRNNDCKLVFLDEPTASVDDATKKDIARIINEEKAKKPETTFIVISHDKEFVKMLDCNIKVKMEKGKIVEEQ
ncbi:MAG: ABC transporter ATP-binding protein [Candidatus Paceibacterota bacterium]